MYQLSVQKIQGRYVFPCMMSTIRTTNFGAQYAIILSLAINYSMVSNWKRPTYFSRPSRGVRSRFISPSSSSHSSQLVMILKCSTEDNQSWQGLVEYVHGFVHVHSSESNRGSGTSVDLNGVLDMDPESASYPNDVSKGLTVHSGDELLAPPAAMPFHMLWQIDGSHPRALHCEILLSIPRFLSSVTTSRRCYQACPTECIGVGGLPGFIPWPPSTQRKQHTGDAHSYMHPNDTIVKVWKV